MSSAAGTGIFCSESGVFVGAIPLLERSLGSGPGGQDQWQTCPVSDINHELSKCYGLPIEFDRKLSGLQVVARALSRGDVIHAQIATVHLEIPTPPVLTKSVQTAGEIIDLASQLSASALLKEDWDPAQHPRWPAGSPDSIGGQFAPADAISDASADDKSSDAPVIPVQITIPVPFDIPSGIPFPSEIVPPPIVVPDIYPRELRNPYPDRPECKDEWANAIRKCRQMVEDGRFGRDDYRGMGEFFYQCVMGHVSAECGGNPTA